MPVTIRIEGASEARANLRLMLREVPEAVGAALYQEGELIMTEAKKRTPVKTGALKGSGHVPPPNVTGGTVTVVLAFGGVAAPYAIYVHENLTARHTNGQAKFLESVVQERAPGLLRDVVERVRSMFGG